MQLNLTLMYMYIAYSDFFDNTSELLSNILGRVQFVSIAAGGLAIAIGGLLMFFGGDGVRKAKGWIIGVLAAIVVIYLAATIVNTVLGLADF